MGAGLMDFIIALVGLIFVGAIIFAGLEFIATDERFKKIARIAVGGVLVLAFLFNLKAVFFGGGGTGIQPVNLLYFAVGVIVLLVVWFIVIKLLEWAATMFPPIGRFMEVIKLVLSALVLIVLLVLAADLLFNAALLGNYAAPFRLQHRSDAGPLALPAAVYL